MREILDTYFESYSVAINYLDRVHGSEIATAVDQLLSRIAACDDVLANNVIKHHHHVLELSSEEWKWFLPSILELERNSAFVAAYLIEKIPFLNQKLDLQVFVKFILEIKNHSARGLSYLIGTSDSVLCDDIESILEVVGSAYYLSAMNCVLRYKDDLGACSALLLIHIKNYCRYLPDAELDLLVCLVCEVHALYGSFGATALLENADKIFANQSIINVQERLKQLDHVSADYLHYLLVNGLPKIESTNSDMVSVEQLNIVSLTSHINSPEVFDGGLISAIISNINFIDQKTIENMQYQLSIRDFESWFQNEPKLVDARENISKAFGSVWFSTFDYCGGEVGIDYFRVLIGQAIEATYDKISRKKLIYRNKTLFDRQTIYTENRLQKMIHAAFPYDSTESTFSDDMTSIRTYLKNHDRQGFRDRQSQKRIFISSWSRNPWQDYSRSDDFYSCTGIGDYAVKNTPGYLVEPNLCRLYVWYQGRRIGRINLVSVADIEGNPGILLDCVEGEGRLLQSEERVLDILNSVSAFTKRSGLDSFFINCKATYNNVPKQFIAQAIYNYGLPMTHCYLRRYHNNMDIYQTMPHGLIPFFESFGNNFSGVVSCLKVTLP